MLVFLMPAEVRRSFTMPQQRILLRVSLVSEARLDGNATSHWRLEEFET
jgi:hypothetical protein